MPAGAAVAGSGVGGALGRGAEEAAEEAEEEGGASELGDRVERPPPARRVHLVVQCERCNTHQVRRRGGRRGVRRCASACTVPRSGRGLSQAGTRAQAVRVANKDVTVERKGAVYTAGGKMRCKARARLPAHCGGGEAAA